MKALKVGAVSFRSRSARARMLLKSTKLSQSEIARRVGITPQCVYQVKVYELGLK